MPKSAVLRLIVRTYNPYGVPLEDLRTARVSVDAIFNEAGIDVRWKDCWRRADAASAPTECLGPLVENEVILRLLAIRTPDNNVMSLGYAVVNLQKRTPYLATVFVNLVAHVTRSTTIEFRALLGYAIAHEIGHLLLNTNRHAHQGLMRALWSRQELGQNDPADWVFRQDEAAIIREAATARDCWTVRRSDSRHATARLSRRSAIDGIRHRLTPFRRPAETNIHLRHAGCRALHRASGRLLVRHTRSRLLRDESAASLPPDAGQCRTH